MGDLLEREGVSTCNAFTILDVNQQEMHIGFMQCCSYSKAQMCYGHAHWQRRLTCGAAGVGPGCQLEGADGTAYPHAFLGEAETDAPWMMTAPDPDLSCLTSPDVMGFPQCHTSIHEPVWSRHGCNKDLTDDQIVSTCYSLVCCCHAI